MQECSEFPDLLESLESAVNHNLTIIKAEITERAFSGLHKWNETSGILENNFHI